MGELLVSANAYIFEDHANAVISKGLPYFADFDPYLEKHIARLEGMIAKHPNNKSPGLSLEHHAQMVIPNKGQILTSNALAKSLLSDQTKGYIEHLQISLAGWMSCAKLSQKSAPGHKTMSAFRYCRTIPIGIEQIGLHIRMSFFEWSPALYKKLQTALGLSHNEALVLQGVLNKQPYAEIATERNRTIDTIKTQAKAVLRQGQTDYSLVNDGLNHRLAYGGRVNHRT